MEGLKFVLVFVVLALASSFASASDPGPLQDFCVAIKETDGGMCLNFKCFVKSFCQELHENTALKISCILYIF